MTVLLSSTLRVGYSGRKMVFPTSLGSLGPDNTPQRSSLLPIRYVHKHLSTFISHTAQMCQVFMHHIWAPPLKEVLPHSALSMQMQSKCAMECNVRFLPETAHILHALPFFYHSVTLSRTELIPCSQPSLLTRLCKTLWLVCTHADQSCVYT